MTLPFENDTGPVIKKLASRSIQTDKRRNLFVIVTIALAAALMAAIFCAGAGSDRKLEADIRGQYQAVVVNCDRDTIERLKDCPEVERWGLSQNYGSARYGDSVLTVEYADANWMELGKKPSFTGTLPQAANDIVIAAASAITIPLLNNLFIILVPPDFLFTGCSVWLKYSSGKCKNILRTVMKMSRKCNSTRFPINHIYSRLLRVTIFFQIPTIFLNLQFRFTFTLFYHSAF